MEEPQQNKKNEFVLIEKIKERPVNKKKLFRRTVITAAMAVIFGLIACFTFLLLEPVISNWLYPEEDPLIVVFPEDQEEMSPEEMLADNMEQQNQQQIASSQNPSLGQDKIQQILSEVDLDINNYRQLYNAMYSYTEDLNKYMVTVTGITSNIDWFNNVEESENKSSGVIIANNGRELLILTDYAPLEKAKTLSLTFYNGVRADASVKQQDATTNLAVLAVDLDYLEESFLKEHVKIASLGSSNLKNVVGIPVVAIGRPMGTSNSLGYGMITSTPIQISEADTNYKLLQTDIHGSQNAGGVLFNLQGQVIGIITNNHKGSDMKNIITAYGITELKKRIEKMSNNAEMAYLGISGVDVTSEANEELGVPFGAYIKEVEMDSPAMQAGIQQGDILVMLNEQDIVSFGEYIDLLMQLEVGETVEVVVMRQAYNEYKEMTFHIVLGEKE
ncbi:MAG: serine protease [Lachnospiraceae bacterium]|nr:serine protease [Lachnospiraceae bacterium]